MKIYRHEQAFCGSPENVIIQSHGVHIVIASEAKQSGFSLAVRGTEDCFVLSLLAMTGGRDAPVSLRDYRKTEEILDRRCS